MVSNVLIGHLGKSTNAYFCIYFFKDCDTLIMNIDYHTTITTLWKIATGLKVLDSIRNVEIFHIEFDAGCKHISEKHNDGVEEYILVQTGTLQLVLNEQDFRAVDVTLGADIRRI